MSPATTWLLVLLTLRPAAEPAPALKYQLLPGVLDQTPGNAVGLYHNAMNYMAGLETQKGLEKKIRAWVDMPMDKLPRQQVLDVLNTSVMRQLALAARRERCDWGIPIRDEGFRAILPPLGRLRSLARLLRLKARIQIAEGDFAGAVHTLQTGYSMARHIADGPTLINGLVGLAVADMMHKTVLELSQAPGSPNLYWALTSLPRPLIDMRKALTYEANFVDLTFPSLQAAAKDGLTRQQWRIITAELGREFPVQHIPIASALVALKLYPDGKRYLVSHGRTPEEVEAMPVRQVVAMYVLESFHRLRDDIFKWFNVPYHQGQAGNRRAEKKLAEARMTGEGFPLTMWLPVLGRAHLMAANAERRIAAMRCIEAIRLYAAGHEGKLPARLSEITSVPIPSDEVTGKPFVYSAEGNTAVLDCPPPAGGADRDGFRYRITLVPQTATQEKDNE